MKTILILLLSASIALSQEPDLNKLLNLEGVTSATVEVTGLKVMHSGGVKRIPINKLPKELVEYYKFNSEESKQAREQYNEAITEQNKQAAEQARNAELLKNALTDNFRIEANTKEGLAVVSYYRHSYTRELIIGNSYCFIPHTAETRNLPVGRVISITYVNDGTHRVDSENVLPKYKLLKLNSH